MRDAATFAVLWTLASEPYHSSFLASLEGLSMEGFLAVCKAITAFCACAKAAIDLVAKWRKPKG